ncbi:MAG: hypothetical protein QXD23_02400 [Candidatus Micrarchaeaceae archaeon]
MVFKNLMMFATVSVLFFGVSYASTLSVSINTQHYVIDAGYNTTVYANVTGGNGNYTCAWSYFNYYVTSEGGNFGNSSCVAVFHGNQSDISNPDQINVEVKDNLGDTGSSSLLIGVDTRLVLNINPQIDTIYAGNSILFTNNTQNGSIKYTGSENYVSYKYLNISNKVIQNGNSFFFNKSGNYKIIEEVTDSNNANATAVANITVLPTYTTVNATLSPTSNTIDLGQYQILKVNATGGTKNYTYSWFVNNIKVSATQSTFKFYGNNSGTYKIYAVVSDNKSSSITQNATIIVNPILRIQLTPNTQTILINQTVKLENTTSGGEAPYKYNYQYNSNATEIGNNFTFKYPGTYTIREIVNDSFGQKNYSNVTIKVEVPKLIVSIKPNLTVLDVGENTTLYSNVTGGFGVYFYQWVINGVKNVTTRNLSISPNVGNYTVALIIKDSVNDSAISNNALIVINQLPVIKLFVPNTTIYTNTTLLVSNITEYGTPPYKYTYEINPSTNLTLVNNTVMFKNKGSYEINETVTDSKGKTASNTIIINVSNVPIKPEYLNVSINPSNFTIHKKQSLTLYANVISSSTINNYSYVWYIKTPYSSKFIALNNSNSETFIFDTYPQSKIGKYYFKVNVNDITTNINSNSSIAVVNLITPASCKNPLYNDQNCDNDNQEQHKCNNYMNYTWNNNYLNNLSDNFNTNTIWNSSYMNSYWNKNNGFNNYNLNNSWNNSEMKHNYSSNCNNAGDFHNIYSKFGIGNKNNFDQFIYSDTHNLNFKSN